MQLIHDIYQAAPVAVLFFISGAEWLLTVWFLRRMSRKDRGVSEEDLDKLREAGERMGRLLATVEVLVQRVSRLEKMIIGLVGAIIAGWAKSKGLW